METLIVKEHNFVDAPSLLTRTAGRLLQVLAWSIASQAGQRRRWDNFRTTATGRGVPYRVWLRHSALLEEIKRQKR